MDQKRAGQSMFLDRCLKGGDANVLVTIERVLRVAAQRHLDAVGQSLPVFEAKLVAEEELLRTAVADEARLVLLLANSNEEMPMAQARSQLKEVRERPKRVRTLKMRLEKERKLALRACEHMNSIGDGSSMTDQLFEFGYFPDIWTGHESLLPVGVPCFVQV